MGRVLVLTGIATLLATLPMELMAQGRASAGSPAHSGTTVAAPTPAGGAHVGAPVVAGSAGRPMSGAAGHMTVGRTANGQVVVRRGTAVHSVQGTARGRATGTLNRRGQLTRRRRNGVSEFENDPNTVPGLGFDYAHFAGTHPNGVRGRGRHNSNDGAVLFPFFDGGYFVPTGPGALNDLPEDGQEVDGGAEQADANVADRPMRLHSADRPLEYGPPAPQPDVPEYVFVRRDGTVFFAVAYSWERNSLRYISSGGVRRSVARDTLDLNATQQFNEQRGMTFRSPA